MIHRVSTKTGVAEIKLNDWTSVAIFVPLVLLLAVTSFSLILLVASKNAIQI